MGENGEVNLPNSGAGSLPDQKIPQKPKQQNTPDNRLNLSPAQLADFDSFYQTAFSQLTADARKYGSHDPEEVAQEALTRLLPFFSSIDPKIRFNYARRTVKNILYDQGRHNLVARSHGDLGSLQAYDEQHVQSIDETLPDEKLPDALGNVISAELVEFLKSGGLDQKYIEALLLNAAGFGSVEISEMLKIGRSAAKIHLVRARIYAKKIMERDGYPT